MPECIYFQAQTKELVAHSSAPIAIFRYGNQISLFSTSTGLSKHRHTRARCYTHSKTTQTKSHFDKSHQPKHWLYSPLPLCSKCIQPPPPPHFSLALTCPVVSRLCVRPIVARTRVAAHRASASKERRSSRIESMSKACKQQQMFSVGADALLEAERIGFTRLND